MEKFRFQVSSMPIYSIRFILTLCLALGIGFLVLVVTDFPYYSFLIVSVIIWLIIEHLTKKLDKGKVEYTIDSEGVRLQWVSPFLLFKRENKFLRWHQIESYKYMSHSRLKVFRIKGNNGEKIDVCFENTPEVFYDFYRHFENKVQSINLDLKKNISIQRKKTFRDTWVGRELITIMGAYMIVLVIGSLFMKPLDEQNWILLIFLFLCGCFLLGVRWYYYRITKKNK